MKALYVSEAFAPVTVSGAGVTAAGAAAMTYSDLVNLMMSLDDAYDANARFAFNNNGLTQWNS